MQVDEGESSRKQRRRKNILLSFSICLFFGRITNLTPPMQVDEGEYGRKQTLLSLSFTLSLFYGRIVDLTPPMELDEGESVESKDDGKRSGSDLLYLFYGRIADLQPPIQVDKGESVESKDDGKVLFWLILFILWQDHGPNAADANGWGRIQ